MRWRSRSGVAALVAILPAVLSGCATSAIDMAPDRPDHPWVPATTDTGEIIPGAKATTAAGSASPAYLLPANPALASVPTPPNTNPAHAYSLAELIDLAESNNLLTRTAWNNAREAALAAGIARSAYLPKLTASAIGGHQSIHNNTPGADLSVNGESSDGVVSALSLQWLLFDFGERTAILNAAEQTSVIANIGFTAAHQQLIHRVSLAYFAERAAHARLETAARSIENAEQVQFAAEERQAHGIGTVVEVAQARQASAQAQLLRVQAEGIAQDAYQALIAAIGISPLTHLQVASLPDRKLTSAATDSVERIVAGALGRRPDVLAAYAAMHVSEENVRATRAEFLPKLFLSATGAYNSGHLNLTAIPSVGQGSPGAVNLTGNQFDSTVFLGITIPIYDGGLRRAMLSQARAKADNAGLALTHTREEAVREIVAAQNAVTTSLHAYTAATSLVSAARTTFEAALAAYRNGVGSITDATVAETGLLQATNTLSDAHSASLAAAATLALAVGELGSAPE